MLAVDTATETVEAAPTSAPADSVYEKQGPATPEQVEKAMKFTKADWVLAGFAILAGTAVSVIGLMSSYKALERKAALPASQGGWAWSEPWMLPIGLDLSILAFSIVNLVLIRVDRPARWVKWVPRLGAAGTIYLNWVSAGSLASQIGHAVLAALWVVFSEIAAHVYAAQIDAIHHRERMEGVRASRWFLDPFSTARIARQMKLWEIRSYAEALQRYKSLKVYRESLTQRYGKQWRKKASPDELLPLKLARLGVTVVEALDLPEQQDAAAAVRAHEADVRRRKLALRLEEEKATEALAEVERQAAIDEANALAEAKRLRAEAELTKAREEARTAADAVVRDAEIAQRIKEAEAAAEAARLAAEAEATAAQLRIDQEKAQLTWEAERARLRREQEAADAEQRAAEAAAQAQAQRRLAEEQRAAALAEQEAAEARRRAAEAAKHAAVQESEAAVSLAEAERREAEERAAAAEAAAKAAALEQEMAVALEAASVAHESARRTPAERQAYIVADMIRQFGQTVVSIGYIERTLDLPHTTAQARRNRALEILGEDAEKAANVA